MTIPSRTISTALAVLMVLVAVAACGHRSGRSTPADGLSTTGPFPSVSGAFGQEPTIRFDPGRPPAPKLQRKVLSLGHGPALAVGDLVAAGYLGQIWNGKVFDNSYPGGQAAILQFGLKKLLPGVDAGLLGVPVGSRVELTVPPSEAYGTGGDKALGIAATDTLVYVFDIAQRYNGKSSGDGRQLAEPAGLPAVTGSLSQAPLVSIPKGTPLPTRPVTTVIARGRGALVHQGSAIIQYYSVNWHGDFVASTWLQGTPTSVPVGNASAVTGGIFDSLVGLRVGSRVLIVVPAPSGQDQASHTAVVAVDILAQVGSPEQMVDPA